MDAFYYLSLSLSLHITDFLMLVIFFLSFLFVCAECNKKVIGYHPSYFSLSIKKCVYFCLVIETERLKTQRRFILVFKIKILAFDDQMFVVTVEASVYQPP